MKMAIGFSFALWGFFLLLAPNMTRPGVLFTVPVDEGFRSTKEGRRAVASYRAWIAVGTFLGSLLLSVSPLKQATELAQVALLIVAAFAFYRGRRAVIPYAVRPSAREHSVDLATMPERLPPWTWLGIGPFVVLAVAGIFLAYHWDTLPTRFPVHFRLDGLPDRWAGRNFQSVYGPLLFGGELCAWVVWAGFAGWYGARRSSLRPMTLGLLIGINFLLALLFAAEALQSELRLPVWAPLAATLAAVLLITLFAIRKSGKASNPPEKTPEQCWKGGIIYYNPNDAALFVEKRTGFGYTINLGNAGTWALLFALLLVIGSARFVLP
jgi:uncharacterized membrane protein